MADLHRAGKRLGPTVSHPSHWRRDLVELAALFTAVTVTDMAAKTIVGVPNGPGLLAASALVLVVTASLHGWWARRRTHAPPALGPFPDLPGRASHGAPAGASLWRLRATVREQPGTLAALCTALARQGVDVLALQTMPLGPCAAAEPGRDGQAGAGPHRDGGGGASAPGPAPRPGAGPGPSEERTVDELLVRAPAGLEAGDLTRVVGGAGGTDVHVERADAHDLVDGPTRALELATRAARDSAELPLALRRLLGRCTISTLPEVSPAGRPREHRPGRDGFEAHRLLFGDPAGGVLIVERAHSAFTPVEYARARALVELDRQLGRRLPRGRLSLTTRDGTEITVRRADAHDFDAVRELHRRCSPRTLRARYHGPVADLDRYLRRLLSPRVGRTLVAQTSEGRTVAVGHLLWDGEETEAALLVEDAWQGRGVGGRLLRRLVELAEEAGGTDVYAVIDTSNTAMISAMRALRLPLHHQVHQGTVVLTVSTAGQRTGV